MVFDLVVSKFFQSPPKRLQLCLQFRLGAGWNGDEDEQPFWADDFGCFLSHNLTDPLVQTHIITGRPELMIINPERSGSNNRHRADAEHNIFGPRIHASMLALRVKASTAIA